MWRREWLVVLGFVHMLVGCSGDSSNDTSSEQERGNIGAPCLLPDESQQEFNGFSMQETYAGLTTPDVCDSEVCLSNHFQGRVSCPYGQTAEQAASDPACFVPDSDEPITVPVDPQIVARASTMTMTCSCQCGGPSDGPLCDCPHGTVCTNLFTLTGGTNTPSYCMVEGSIYDPLHPPSPEVCVEVSANCGDARPYPP